MQAQCKGGISVESAPTIYHIKASSPDGLEISKVLISPSAALTVAGRVGGIHNSNAAAGQWHWWGGCRSPASLKYAIAVANICYGYWQQLPRYVKPLVKGAQGLGNRPRVAWSRASLNRTTCQARISNGHFSWWSASLRTPQRNTRICVGSVKSIRGDGKDLWRAQQAVIVSCKHGGPWSEKNRVGCRLGVAQWQRSVRVITGFCSARLPARILCRASASNF